MKKTTKQPLTKLADAAFEQAAQKVVKRAEESGTPVIVWEEDAVKEVAPNRKGKAPAPQDARSNASRKQKPSDPGQE